MHEAIPNLSTLASGMVAGGVSVTAFWLGVVGTIWKMFLEPYMKRVETAHAAAMAQLRADRDRDNERCDRQIEAHERRIQELELMSNLRQQTQAAISGMRVGGGT